MTFPKCEFERDEQSSILEIDDLKSDDFGDYVCHAGKMNHTFRLQGLIFICAYYMYLMYLEFDLHSYMINFF